MVQKCSTKIITKKEEQDLFLSSFLPLIKTTKYFSAQSVQKLGLLQPYGGNLPSS